jgi:hypothetical protein
MQRKRPSQGYKRAREHQYDSRQRQSPKDGNFKSAAMKHNPTGYGTGTKDAFVRKWLEEIDDVQESSLNIIKPRHSEFYIKFS